MKGYFAGSPDNVHRTFDSWLPTGDLGFRDEDGALYVVGRLDSMFTHHGLNIYPEYVCGVLEGCEAVQKAEVVHVSEGGKIDRLLAFVEPVPGVSASSMVSTLRSHLVEHLEIRKHPDEIVPTSQLPVTPSGKVDIKQLLETYRTAASA